MRQVNHGTCTKSTIHGAVIGTRLSQALAVCWLCGDALPAESASPLCPACEQEQHDKWADYRAEQEQVRHPA